MDQNELYGEVILFVNLVMNYAILWLTSKFANITIAKKRLFAGSMVGALYALAMFLPDIGYLYSTIGKLLFSVFILVVTFAPVKTKKFLIVLGYFYLVSFSLIGIAVGISYFINSSPDVAMAYNKVLEILNLYFWYALIMTILTGIFVGKFVPALLKKKIVRNFFKVPLSIDFGGKTVKIEALIDTGNNLRDPLSQMPVIIVEYSALEKILPNGIKQAFAGGGEPVIEEILGALEDAEWIRRIRLIPFNSLGKHNGMLIAFRPDQVEINNGNEMIKTRNIVIGIHHRQLCHEGSYRALLNPDILQAAFS